MSDPTFNITREKHLDHLVKVVPLIVLGYGVQSYLLMQMKGPFGSTTLFVLGAMMIFWIWCFFPCHCEDSLPLVIARRIAVRRRNLKKRKTKSEKRRKQKEKKKEKNKKTYLELVLNQGFVQALLN